MTLLYLVRHGETNWNRERRIQGSTDIPLNETGRAQADSTGALLAQREWDGIFASPLSRAFETAEIIASRTGLRSPEPLPAVVERAYGKAEGMRDFELDALFPPGTDVPGRESREAVTARVVPALCELADAHPDQALIVVSHGGVIRAVLDHAEPDRSRQLIRNGSIHSFRHVDGSLQLIAFDDPIDEDSLLLASDDLDEQNALERRG